MRREIREFIIHFAKEHDKEGIIKNIWREPLVCFGDANNPNIDKLKEVVHPEHVLPKEILPEAKVIIAYFFPFTKEIGDTNKMGRLSSKEWAMAYEKTNAAFGDLNKALIAFLRDKGYKAAVTPEAFQYDESILKSRWSQRHIANLCGLGTFGINNMLITDAGCCGRIGTVVTDLDIEIDTPLAIESCLFKYNGSCGVCIDRCPVKALTKDNYNRLICNGLCNESAGVNIGYGSSYKLANSGEEVVGTNTCGKCVVGVPCTYKKP